MERRPNQLIDSIPREATKELMSIINMVKTLNLLSLDF